MKLAGGILALTLAAALSGTVACAQTPNESVRPTRMPPPCLNPPAADLIHTFYLKNVSYPVDANEIYTALRQMLPPDVKSYLIPSQEAIIMCGTPDQAAIAQKLIDDLDRPKKTYRLTYTVTEMDGSKRIGTEHFAMVTASGQLASLKQGSRVPVATGATQDSKPQTQFTYLDVGMNFEATLTGLGNGANLQTRVDQSSVAQEKSGIGLQNPVLRQTSLRNVSYLTPGKPLMIGALDIPGSTRHLDIEAVIEQLP